MQLKSQMDNDEITLVDVYEFFASGWRFILLACVAGAGLGLAVSFVLPQRYQATAYVAPGQVAGKLVDELPRVVSALRSEASYTVEAMRGCPDVAQNQSIASMVSRLTVSGVPNTAYLRVQYLAGTGQTSKQCLESIVQMLRQNEARVFDRRTATIQLHLTRSMEELQLEQRATEQLLSSLRSRRAELQSEAKELNGLLEDISKRVVTDIPLRQNEATLDSVFLVNTVTATRRDLRNIADALDALEVKELQVQRESREKLAKLGLEVDTRKLALLAPDTQAAHIVGTISVSEGPVSPNRKLMALLGLCLGGGAATTFLMFRSAYRSAKQRKAARQQLV